MLAKKQRMLKSLARDVFMRGSSQASAHFLYKLAAGLPATPAAAGVSPAADGSSLFAVSISKKVAPTAVLRNRTRRRVYSVIRDLLPRFRSGTMLAISVKKGGEKLAHAEIAKEIEGQLSRMRLIK